VSGPRPALGKYSSPLPAQDVVRVTHPVHGPRLAGAVPRRRLLERSWSCSIGLTPTRSRTAPVAMYATRMLSIVPAHHLWTGVNDRETQTGRIKVSDPVARFAAMSTRSRRLRERNLPSRRTTPRAISRRSSTDSPRASASITATLMPLSHIRRVGGNGRRRIGARQRLADQTGQSGRLLFRSVEARG
jgi:hypothetical protein